MITTLLVLCAFIILLYRYIVYYIKIRRLTDLIPEVTSIPILGHTLYVYPLTQEEIWTYLRTISKFFYPITKVWMFLTLVIIIRHPDDVETILSSTKHIQKGFIYKFLHPWLNTGLLTSTGAKWHKRRRILTPAFHFNILKQFIDILVEEGDRMAKSLKNNKDTIVTDLNAFISHHTLNAICETAMGASLQEISFQKKYRQAIHDMGEIVSLRLLKPWYYSDIIYNLLPAGRRQTKILEILHGFTEKIIAERKDYHLRTNRQHLKFDETNTVTDANNMEDIGIRKRLAMLDLLIAASHDNNLSDMDIREEVDTFMFEGHDTVASGICFFLLLLAEHKEIQDQVRNEVDIAMEENGGKLTMTILQNLPYLERCLKESLRLYPSVPHITRICAEDVKLHSCIVPSGTTIAVNIYDLHRDPKFWSNPNTFDPDRFLPEKIKGHHPFSYVPFSAGPRNCIGQRFASLEVKAVVAQLLHNFHLEPVDHLKDLHFIFDLILRTSHPLRIKFVPIKSVHSNKY